MKVWLGGLTIAVAILFGFGLLLSMARAAWQPNSSQHSAVGFFGFAIPMVFLAVATFGLWGGNKNLQIKLGWISALFGLVWAVGLFVLIADWVKIVNIREKSVGLWEGMALFAGFVIPMLVCGGTGIGMIVDNSKGDVSSPNN